MPDIHPITVIGLLGGEWFGRAARDALRAADICIGASRHLGALPDDLAAKRVEYSSLAEVLTLAEERQAAGEQVCLLASGDPGFFGLARAASARFGPGGLVVFPAPSSVATAFARLGLNWDDALVVSAHGRPLETAVEAVLRHEKVAVLVSPDTPPEALGRALVAAGCGARTVAVVSHLGDPEEQILHTDLPGLARGSYDGLSVVVVLAPSASVGSNGLTWGLPDDRFEHRAGMVTKAEVRAVALGKLDLPAVGALWDVGAGSGSVAIECARLAPGLAVYAIERRADDVERIRANAARLLVGKSIRVIEGDAPAALADLPDPDRVFVGGGGLDVLEAVLARLRPGGTVVATYAALDRAAAAAARLGHLVQIQVSRGVPIGPGSSLRLAAENPVFICWGPTRT